MDSDSEGEYSPSAQRISDFEDDSSEDEHSPDDSLRLTPEDEVLSYDEEEGNTGEGSDASGSWGDFDEDYDQDNDLITSTLLNTSPLILQHLSTLFTRISASQAIPFKNNDPVKVSRCKAVHGFEKVSEWEMTIQKGEELLVVSLGDLVLTTTNRGSPTKNSATSPSKGTAGTPTDPTKQDRWASIIDEDDTRPPSPLKKRPLKPSVRKKSVKMKLEPDLPDFLNQMKEFINYQDSYGVSWVTGLKVRVRAKKKAPLQSSLSRSSTERKIKITMLDIGLIPSSYIELKNSPTGSASLQP
jgi:hypothetical protein